MGLSFWGSFICYIAYIRIGTISQNVEELNNLHKRKFVHVRKHTP
jgi:hypothetical protein